MKPTRLLLAVALSACGPGADPLEVGTRHDGLVQETGFGSNPGGLALYLELPASPKPSPALVVALHGCTQTATSYATIGWNELAQAEGFLVAYPQVTTNGGCFDWFDAAQQSRTGAQVTSILQMVSHLEQTRGVDPSRVFVTGLSAGGAMSNVLLAVAPDVFSRGAVMAGVPFGCASTLAEGFGCMSTPPDKSPSDWAAKVSAVAGGLSAPRVMLWHGDADGTVRPSSLGEEVDQWVGVNAIDATADATSTIGPAIRREFRNDAGLTLVESWLVSGMGHGTPVDVLAGCGAAGAYNLDVQLCASARAAQFFGLLAPAPPDAGTGGGAGGGAGGGSGGGAAGGGAGGGSSPSPSTTCGCSAVESSLGALAAVLSMALRRRRSSRG